MSAQLPTQLVLDALIMAIWQRRPQQVIHHYDQGTQYTSIAFGLRLGEVGVRAIVCGASSAAADWTRLSPSERSGLFQLSLGGCTSP